MKKIFNKRHISIVLVFVILFTYIQVPKNNVYANTISFYGTTSAELQTAINNALNGDTIVLQNDILFTSNIIMHSGKSITITDNGAVRIIKRSLEYDFMVTVESNATLTLIGTGIDTLIFDADRNVTSWLDNGGIVIVSGGTLNIYNGVVFKNSKGRGASSGSCSAILVARGAVDGIGGTLNMYGGTVTNNGSMDFPSYYSGNGGVYIYGYCTFNMYGGVISNNSNGFYDEDMSDDTGGGGVFLAGGSTFNMTGGKIINNKSRIISPQGYYGYLDSQRYTTVSITGGIISDNYVLATGLILSGSSTVNKGYSIPITATVSPSNVADTSLLWYSSNSSVATVNSSGVVTGVSSGTVTITAVANDGSGVKATKIITVQSLITNITLSGSTSVTKGDTINILATVTPNTVSNKTLTWTSSDTNIATVDNAGLVGIVRGISKGTATIIATSNDGSGVTASKTISVISSFVSSEAGYILIDDVVEYVTAWTDTENDPLYEEQYRYVHTPTIFKNNIVVDNTMGLITDNNTWTKTQYKHFSKVGTYTIQYRVKDNPPTANTTNFEEYRYYSDYSQNTIYVHRKPIAAYSISSDVINDSSFDLDHSISYSNKGIAKWKWVCVSNTGVIAEYTSIDKATGVNSVNNWINSYKPVGYKIVLRVQDIEGAWSEPCIKSATGYSKPIANFAIDKNPMIYKNDTQTITDLSYDTNGIGLTLAYSWIVSKNGTNILNSSSNNITSALNSTINSLYPNVTGTYYISLKVTNSAGIESNIITKSFSVLIKNDAPTANFELVSNENPVWIFPKTLGLYTLRYRASNTLFSEEYARFDTNIVDPNADNTGFIYNWKLDRFAVKDINNISGSVTNTYNYTTQFPFVNSFKNQGLGWGAYKITLKVTDKPPIPPYQSTDAKSTEVTKYYYIVPEISIDGSFESAKSEIMVGNSIKLKAKTNKIVDTVGCNFNGAGYSLSKSSEDSNYAYWEKNITIPESITDSGTYKLEFVGKTTYGGNGNVTREVKDTAAIDIVALKLINFRITNIVNHPYVTFPYTKDMLLANLIPYKAGYYVTFQIDSKGKPDNVYGRIDVGSNGSMDQVINMTKVVTGDTETWQGRFYSSAHLPVSTVISIKLDCLKGSVTYDYNYKENWDGRSLITNGSALQDGRINLIY